MFTKKSVSRRKDTIPDWSLLKRIEGNTLFHSHPRRHPSYFRNIVTLSSLHSSKTSPRLLQYERHIVVFALLHDVPHKLFQIHSQIVVFALINDVTHKLFQIHSQIVVFALIHDVTHKLFQIHSQIVVFALLCWLGDAVNRQYYQSSDGF